jgi:hypothetical protein
MLSFQRPDLEPTNISGSYDIWMLELPSTYPFRLSNVGQKADRLMFDPNNRHLLLSIDDDGDENPQIFAVSLHGGPLLPVIKNEHSKNHLQAISHDGKNLYYASDKDNPNFMNKYKKNIVTDVEETILVGEGALTFITFVSPVKAQSDIIVNALRERNRKVEYIVLEDEGHGFSKKDNEIFVYTQIFNFLNKYID